MTITLFGASGRTGREVVRRALDRGYRVRAFARTPGKIDVQDELLEIVEGDVQDEDAVARATFGSDAVLSVLGPTNNRPDRVVARGTGHIVAAMRRHGVRRLIVTAGAGVADPRDRPGLANRLIKIALLALARNVYEDMRQTVELVRASGLDWTVVRIPRLTDRPATGAVRSGYLGGDVGTQIGRADVASFLLDRLESNDHLHDAPVISS